MWGNDLDGACGESTLTFSEEDPNDPTDWDEWGQYSGSYNYDPNCQQVSPCPTSLAYMADIWYTIGDNAQYFNVPNVSNTNCLLSYSFMIRSIGGGPAISFDSWYLQFKVFYIDSLLLSGAEYKDYTVTVKGGNS